MVKFLIVKVFIVTCCFFSDEAIVVHLWYIYSITAVVTFVMGGDVGKWSRKG